MKLNIILILIILLLITYIIFVDIDFTCTNDYNICTKTNNEFNYLLNSIDGYWISNDNFNKESEIDKMILYIDFNSYSADLVIIINNKIILNDKYNIYIDEDNITKDDNILKFKISFSNSNKEKKYIWNNKSLNCILSPNKGTIQLHDDNNILYGDFIKDHIISNFINNL